MAETDVVIGDRVEFRNKAFKILSKLRYSLVS